MIFYSRMEYSIFQSFLIQKSNELDIIRLQAGAEVDQAEVELEAMVKVVVKDEDEVVVED